MTRAQSSNALPLEGNVSRFSVHARCAAHGVCPHATPGLGCSRCQGTPVRTGCGKTARRKQVSAGPRPYGLAPQHAPVRRHPGACRHEMAENQRASPDELCVGPHAGGCGIDELGERAIGAGHQGQRSRDAGRPLCLPRRVRRSGSRCVGRVGDPQALAFKGGQRGERGALALAQADDGRPRERAVQDGRLEPPGARRGGSRPDRVPRATAERARRCRNQRQARPGRRSASRPRPRSPSRALPHVVQMPSGGSLACHPGIEVEGVLRTIAAVLR